jgi:hypothetical protein
VEFITVKTSHQETDLLVLKSRLEAEGIKCFLKNQFTAQIMSHMATFMVELQVHKSDLDRVREILIELEEN